MRYGLCAVLIALAGCPDLSPQDTSPESGPDIGAILTVVKDVYGIEGGGRMIFLGANNLDVNNATLAVTRVRLETDLQVKVRPESEADRTDPDLPVLTPVLLETGEIGISITLGRFTAEEPGRLRVSVMFARSGLDGAELAYILEQVDGSWGIIDRTVVAIA